MLAVGCVTLTLVLVGCLFGLLIVRWQRRASRCSADDESKTDEAAESRRILTRDGDVDAPSSAGWMRRVLSRATRTGAATHDDRYNKTVLRERKPPPTPKLQPKVIRYSNPDCCRLSPKMLWTHYLVGASHFAKFRKNQLVPV